MEEKVWAGVDVGKEFHWAHVVDASGRALLSHRVDNDEMALTELIDEVLGLAEGIVWATDQPGGGAALLLALLWEQGQPILYVPGLGVDRARDGYRGESKTDRKDARVIADQARMRGDLGRLEPEDGAIAELQLLLARRRDLVADRTRAVTRLRETLLALFPALERAFNFNTRGPLELIARYQSAGAVRRAGRKRVAAYLKKRGVVKADALAGKAVAAARSQNVTLPAEDVAAKIVAELAEGVLVLKKRVDELDGELERRFHAQPEARVLSSFPGMGPILEQSSSSRLATPPPSAAPTGWRPTRASSPPPGIPASGWATTVRDAAATRSSNGFSTNRRSLACAPSPSPGPSTTVRGVRARGTRRP